MIRAALLMLAKDLRLFVRDPVAVLLAVALPMVLVTVFGAIMGNLSFGGGGGGMPAVEVALVDLDESVESRAFIAALQSAQAVDLEVLDESRPRDHDDLVAMVSNGDTPFVIVLVPGFGTGAELRLIRDPGRALDTQLLSLALIQGLLEARGADLILDVQRRALVQAGIPEAWMGRVDAFTAPFQNSMKAIFEEADEDQLLGELDGEDDQQFDMGAALTGMLPMTTEDVAPEGRDAQLSFQLAQAVSGMTVMMLMFSLVAYARTLLEERDQGTLNRLFLAPVDRRAVLLSKFLGTWLMGMVLTGVLFGWAALIFDLAVLPRWDTLLVVSAATSATVTGFAMLIASVARTDKQADGMSTILILVMSAMGGAWMPLNIMPEFIRRMARFTITYWSMDGYLASFWYDLHWTDPAVLDNLGILAGISVVLSLLATWVFRRRYLPG